MQGASIEQVRNALQLCLRSMIAGCRFNIVSFGSDFGSLFPESRIYDEASLSAASAFVDGMTADRGGTEILPALRSVLAAGAVAGVVAAGGRAHRRRGDEHRRGDRAGESARHDDACVHLRHRRRPEPAPRAGPGARRPRQRRVHRAWRAHRTEGRAPVRPAPGTCRHERGGALGRPGRGVRAVRHSAALRRRTARDLWLREGPDARDRDPHRKGPGWAVDFRIAHRSGAGATGRRSGRSPPAHGFASSRRARSGRARARRVRAARGPAASRRRSSTWPCGTAWRRARHHWSRSSSATRGARATWSFAAFRSR